MIRSKSTAHTTLYWGMITYVMWRVVYRAQLFISSAPLLWRKDDFNHYYTSAWLLLHGAVPYGLSFKDSALASHFIWDPLIPQATNPPFLLLLTMPLALFHAHAAWVIWLLINLTCVLVAFILTLSLIGQAWSWREKLLILLLFVSSDAFCANFMHAQVQPLILLFIVLGWWWARRERYDLCALLWGISVAVKFYTWPLLVLLLAWRRYRAFFAGASCTLLFLLLPAALFGVEILSGFVHDAMPIVERSAKAFPHNFSLSKLFCDILHIQLGHTSTLMRLLCLYAAPMGATLILCEVLGRGSSTNGLRETARLDFSVAIIAALSFFVAPVTWEHYLIVLLIPMLVGWHYSKKSLSLLIGLLVIWQLVLQMPTHASLSFLSSAVYFRAWRIITVAGCLALFGLVATLRQRFLQHEISDR